MRLAKGILLAVLVIAEACVLYGIVAITAGVAGSGWSGFGRMDFGGPIRAKEEEFIPLGDADVVVVENDIGKVTVLKAADNEASGVKVIKYGYGISSAKAEESVGLVEVSVEKTADGYRIVADSPNYWAGNTPHADLTVLLPAGAAVQAHAKMGAVHVEGIAANATVDADMGGVVLIGIKGNIDVEANMGRVDLRDITVTDKLKVDANMGSVYFQGRLGRENTIDANMGSVEIDLVADHPAINLDAIWKMGSMHNDITFSGAIKDRSAQGVLGKGAAQGNLTVKVDMGSIRIK